MDTVKEFWRANGVFACSLILFSMSYSSVPGYIARAQTLQDYTLKPGTTFQRDYFTTFHVDPAPVPEHMSPVKAFTATASDGGTTTAVLRFPPGKGPFPAIILIHGGTDQRPLDGLYVSVMENPVYTRYLAAGYVTVAATYRSYSNNTRQTGAVLDIMAVVGFVKALPKVDEESVVLYGGSGGGALSLEVATRIPLPAIGLGEPATSLYGGYYTDEDLKNDAELNRPTRESRGRVSAIFTDEEMNQRCVAKLMKIQCPMLIMQGNVHPVNTGINEQFKPALRETGKNVVYKPYPGMKHGFYFGRHEETSVHIIERIVSDVTGFFGQHIRVKPMPVILSQQ